MMLHFKSFVAVYTLFFFPFFFPLSLFIFLSSPPLTSVACVHGAPLFNNAWIDVTCISPVIQVPIWGLFLEKAGGHALCRLNLINSCHFIITMRRVISHFLFLLSFLLFLFLSAPDETGKMRRLKGWRREREREAESNRPYGESLLFSKGHVTAWLAEVSSKIVSDPPSLNLPNVSRSLSLSLSSFCLFARNSVSLLAPHLRLPSSIQLAFTARPAVTHSLRWLAVARHTKLPVLQEMQVRKRRERIRSWSWRKKRSCTFETRGLIIRRERRRRRRSMEISLAPCILSASWLLFPFFSWKSVTFHFTPVYLEWLY